MPNKSYSTALVAFFVGVAPLAAQQAASCTGPGAAFGVTSYQCASCSIKQVPGGRTQYVFQAEPVVLETSAGSALKVGDVIEAMNGDPIMTQAGAQRFTYPAAGPAMITIRRGGSRIQLVATTVGCGDKPDGQDNANRALVIVDGVAGDLNQVDKNTIDQVEVLKGPSATALYGPRAAQGVILITTKRAKSIKPPADPLFIIDGVVQPSTSEVELNQSSSGRRFGFAVGCLPSCTRSTAADGTAYYRFDGYPTVAALTPGGSAERAGVRVGDVISEIDGKSILGEDGSLRFLRANKAETLQMTVLRDRQPVSVLLKAR